MQNDYAVTQKVIHWLMGIFIMLDLFIAEFEILSAIMMVSSRIITRRVLPRASTMQPWDIF